MKYLMVIVVVWIAILLWRQNRRNGIDRGSAARPRADTLPQPQPMARCAHCGLHLPATDAVAGRLGSYCTVAHRQAAEP